MTVASLTLSDLKLNNAVETHFMFQRLGYDVYEPSPFEGRDLDDFELDKPERRAVQRAYVVAERGNHTVYLYEVNDLSAVRLRGLAWHALQRGMALQLVTRDYREVVFVDPRFAGSATKSNVRVNKLKVVTADPTRHDLDTLNKLHAHRRTAQQIYDSQAEAFNVTSVTKRFYEEYRRHYEHALALICQYNPGVHEFQNDDQTDKLHAFTQRLLGRLMFLYFLQRKGWLGGKSRFLTDKYIETMRQHAGEHDQETFYYYREVLEPLFFQTMNTKRPGDITLWSGIRIPYLNGGLFDEARDPAGPILLPDSLFDPQSADGVLAFFNRYNFTIADDTPLEQDVAVDPEMLGKVFENMLEERDRGQSGSFYTPRTIVAYMCQEALAGYLEESAGVPRETTRAQFDPDSELQLTAEEAQSVNAALDTLTVLDPAVGSGSFLVGMMAEIIRLRSACYFALEGQGKVPAELLANWKEAIIRDTLYGVDIKPEAIEIAQLRLWLALVVDQTLEQARPLPNLDYKLMAGNSLIETIDGEPVLGEFAASIMQPGADVQWEHVRDQLQMFDPNPTQGRMLLFDEEKQVQHERIQLDKLRAEFFNSLGARRKELRAEITAQERRIVYASLREKGDAAQQTIDHYGKIAAQSGGTLRRADEQKLNAAVQKLGRIVQLQADMAKPDAALPFFLYRLHFSEVFERKGGFDILVENPPYVRGDVLGELKDELLLAYPHVYGGRADLYVYFYVKSHELLRANGQFSVISSSQYQRANYGKKLRSFVANQFKLREIVDLGELDVFKQVATFAYVLVAEKKFTSQQAPRFTQLREWSDSINLLSVVEELGVTLPSSAINQEQWTLSDTSTISLVRKLSTLGMPLGDYINGKIFYGIKTGFNKAFVIDDTIRAELIAKDPKSVEIIKPFIVGDDVRKWYIRDRSKFLIFTLHGIEINRYPAIKNYLSDFKTKLENRATIASHPWYELQQPQMGVYHEFETSKIVYPEMAQSSRYTLDTTGAYINNKCFFIPSSDMFLLGILNSSTVWFYSTQTCSRLLGNTYEHRTIYVRTIPIPNPPTELRERIATQVRRCLDAAASAPEKLPALEEELNALVYAAYGLDDDDIRVIEAQIGGRAGVELSAGEDEGDEA